MPRAVAACQPPGALAIVERMPRNRIHSVDAETRATVASAGGSARAAALPAETRSEIARSGAAKTNSPLNYAQRIRRQWGGMSRAERAEVREVLGGCRGLFPAEPKTPRAPVSARALADIEAS
jgi:hypothetical protein